MPPNRPRYLRGRLYCRLAPLTSSQLDALVAPIALDPDALVDRHGLPQPIRTKWPCG